MEDVWNRLGESVCQWVSDQERYGALVEDPAVLQLEYGAGLLLDDTLHPTIATTLGGDEGSEGGNVPSMDDGSDECVMKTPESQESWGSEASKAASPEATKDTSFSRKRPRDDAEGSDDWSKSDRAARASRERSRRAELNANIKLLSSIVPSCEGKGNCKTAVIEKAITHIDKLEERIATLSEILSGALPLTAISLSDTPSHTPKNASTKRSTTRPSRQPRRQTKLHRAPIVPQAPIYDMGAPPTVISHQSWTLGGAARVLMAVTVFVMLFAEPSTLSPYSSTFVRALQGTETSSYFFPFDTNTFTGVARIVILLVRIGLVGALLGVFLFGNDPVTGFKDPSKLKLARILASRSQREPLSFAEREKLLQSALTLLGAPEALTLEHSGMRMWAHLLFQMCRQLFHRCFPFGRQLLQISAMARGSELTSKEAARIHAKVAFVHWEASTMNMRTIYHSLCSVNLAETSRDALPYLGDIYTTFVWTFHNLPLDEMDLIPMSLRRWLITFYTRLVQKAPPTVFRLSFLGYLAVSEGRWGDVQEAAQKVYTTLCNCLKDDHWDRADLACDLSWCLVSHSLSCHVRGCTIDAKVTAFTLYRLSLEFRNWFFLVRSMAGWGKSLVDEGRYEECISFVKSVLELDSTGGKALIPIMRARAALAEAYYGLGDRRNAFHAAKVVYNETRERRKTSRLILPDTVAIAEITQVFLKLWDEAKEKEKQEKKVIAEEEMAAAPGEETTTTTTTTTMHEDGQDIPEDLLEEIGDVPCAAQLCRMVSESVKNLLDLAQLFPITLARAHYYLGQYFERCNQREKALVQFRKALQESKQYGVVDVPHLVQEELARLSVKSV